MVANPERLHSLLSIAVKEAKHLQDTAGRLSQEAITADWVARLDNEPLLSERVDAFVARFGRLQDHLGDKLTPALLAAMLEPTGSAIDNLNRMEKLGLLSSTLDWVEARNLRNRLIHEYVDDSHEFAQALLRALELVPLLITTQQNYVAKASASSTN